MCFCNKLVNFLLTLKNTDFMYKCWTFGSFIFSWTKFITVSISITSFPTTIILDFYWEKNQKLSLVHKVRIKKKRDTFKHWLLVKNPQFLLYSYETLWKWLPHELIIFTNFHGDRTKNVDFLLMTNFWTCLVFLTQTLGAS